MKKKQSKKIKASTSKKAPRSLPVLHKHVIETRTRKVSDLTTKQKAARKQLQAEMKKVLKHRINRQTQELYTDQEIKRIISDHSSVLLQKEHAKITRYDQYYFKYGKKKDGTQGKRFVIIKGKGAISNKKFKAWKKRQDYWDTVRGYSKFHDITTTEARVYLKIVYNKIHKGKRERERTLRALKEKGYKKNIKPTEIQQQYLDQLARIRKQIAEAYLELYS